ncbi:O-linked N-acetylglucosamine transferase, SPINDLY family protein [Methylobacterium sp. ID0610]|uniref:O-linked N-acetylglucosamine transferase, SPINDLY family protein n=1 Tax=Methylobacterium carpenticola TaxID=3344827 RepID=UPI00369C6F82
MSAVEARFGAACRDHEAGRAGAAETGYGAVLAAAPGHPGAAGNLASLLCAAGRAADAIAVLTRALRAAPEAAGLRASLAALVAESSGPDRARPLAEGALALQPDLPEAWFHLGNLLRSHGERAGAERAYRRATRARPDFAGAWSNLGDMRAEAGALAEAVACYRTALGHRPDLPQPRVNLGEALKAQGLAREAAILLQDGLALHPDLPLLHANLLLTLHYLPAVPPPVLARAHAHWNRRHAAGFRPDLPVYAHARDPARRLRIGYVSPDLCTHACASFILPLFGAHDRRAVEVVAYALSERRDAVTERLERRVDLWRPLSGHDDAEAAALIRADRVDILVDLAGHTAGARPLIFARTPAPVQVAWLGYPDTTGMPAIGHRLTDAWADPPGPSDGWHSERLVRLPGGFLCFEPLAEAEPGPARGPEEPPTFGSFNNLAKLTPQVVALWGRLLRAVPGSRLVLKSGALADSWTRERYRTLFARAGVGAERLILAGHVAAMNEHLRAYHRVDVALDPFPYNGTTTTCEALWMGVPVVTLAGTHHVARVGVSLLNACGLPDLVAETEDAYLDIAAALAADPARRATLRTELRRRMLAAPLGDPARFARTVEAAYRALWQDWLATADPA